MFQQFEFVFPGFVIPGRSRAGKETHEYRTQGLETKALRIEMVPYHGEVHFGLLQRHQETLAEAGSGGCGVLVALLRGVPGPLVPLQIYHPTSDRGEPIVPRL